MSNEKQKKYSGLTVSVPLFFNHDDSIDFDTLGKYLHDVCANQHIAAIYSMAYNTRYRMLSDNEVYLVNKFIVEICNEFEKNVYIGHPYSCNRQSLTDYFNKISKFNICGVSMLYPERYYGEDDIIIDFLKFPNEFGLPTVLHEMKLVSGFNGELINWPSKLLQKVFNETNIVAVKEDSKDDQIAIEVLKLCKENSVSFVLAGGGKRRALKFLDLGIQTWLNGSTMFAPSLIDKAYQAFVTKETKFIQMYLDNIEDPFFDQIVSKYGWHLSHKAILEYFGYGKRHERFPHASMSDHEYEKCTKVFSNISKAMKNV
jgi:dihydrodipicolinate synthase/N-acetylneuraminate lyase